MVIMFAIFTIAVLAVVAYTVALGVTGVALAVIIGVGMTWASYWKSDVVALRMSRAVEATPDDYARYHNIVEGLCIAGGLPKPRLYVVNDDAPNAFATGRNPNNAAVAVTTGLLDRMDRMELEGVLAHELSHVKNYDILVNTIAVTMVGILTLLADFTFRSIWISGHRRRGNDGNGPAAIMAVVGIVLLVVAPIIGRMMQYAIGRKRESLADFSAVELTRYPPGLISALEKLRDDPTVVRSASRATAHMWIEEPMAQVPEDGNLSRLNRLFSTHPPLEERIAALREL
ncbi:MAG: M48 family metallopeptidase [Actinomycetia bacterium]|nr:M48 family metallopeptidase [Actinomycetes bacterium]MCP4086751.1 M48 family metallopeptidase [Actinomycetes bacterium]